MKGLLLSIILVEMLLTGCVRNIDKMTPSPKISPEVTDRADDTPGATESVTPTSTPLPTPSPTPISEPVTNVYQAVKRLVVAEKASHVFVVLQREKGPECDFYAFKRQGNEFVEVFNTVGLVGKNGIATIEEKHEGDYRTPAGIYTFGMCFGIKDDNGISPLGYTVVGEDDYWDSNPESDTYNQWIKKKDLPATYDKTKYENLISKKGTYNYVAAINYNVDPIIKGKGSAIFLHCTKEGSMLYTGGCIAIPEDKMLIALSMIYSDTYIVIASSFDDLMTHVR